MRSFLILAALAAVFVAAAWRGARSDSATFDETAHVGDGVAVLERDDYRLNPEHPPLVKVLAAIPLETKGVASPDFASEAWRRGDEWVFGFETLNGPLNDPRRRDPMRLLLPARLIVVGLGLLLGLVVWDWSRSLFGGAGGLVSAFLFALSPTMLAHAHLVTTDLAAAFGFTLSIWAFRRYVMAPSLPNGVTAGVATGVALLAKFSTLLLAPILVIVAVFQVAFPPAGSDRKRVLETTAIGLVAIAALSWGSIWAGYHFRFAASPDPSYRLAWDARAKIGEGIPPSIEFMREHHLLPEAYLFGLTAARQDASAEAYLNGEVSTEGWASYFPIAFALKTPPALMALAAWALVLGLWNARLRLFSVACLVVPIVVYVGFSMSSGLNIGHRHLAPVEPFLFVMGGAIPGLVAKSKVKTWIAGLLLGAYAVSFAFATPRYLTYFNVFAGGREGGSRYLLDSNLDWGQDLIRLKRWMNRHHEQTVALAYFGTGDPAAYGIRATKIAFVRDFRPDEPAVPPASGGLVAVSENLLHGLYLHDDGGPPEQSVGAWIRTLPQRATYLGKAGDSIRIYRMR